MDFIPERTKIFHFINYLDAQAASLSGQCGEALAYNQRG